MIKKAFELKNYTLSGILFSLSLFMIIFANEGSFTIQSILPAIFVIIIIMVIQKKSKFLINRKIKALFLLNCVYIISLFLNNFIYGMNGFYSLIQILYQITIFLWFFLLSQNKPCKGDIKLFINTLIFLIFLSSIYIIYKNLFQNLRTFSITTILGITINKNHFGTLISMALLFNFYYLLYYNKNKLKKILYLISFITIFIAMLFSNSRGAIISSAICIFIVFLIYLFKSNISINKIIIIMFIPLAILILYRPILNLIPEWLYNRYFVNDYKDDSNMSRLSRWENGIEGLANSPLIGYGPGIFVSIPEYAVTDFGNYIPANTPTHNTYLDVAVDGGLIGLFIFLYFLGLIYLPFFSKNKIIYLPIILHILMNSMILGAGKTVYFWNINIFLVMLSIYVDFNSEEYNIFIS